MAVEIGAVSHHYGRTAALEAVSLSLPAATTIGLIGPDGVGKSTLLGLDRRVRKAFSRQRAGARRRSAQEASSAGALPAHGLHAARARPQSLPDPVGVREHRFLRPPVRPCGAQERKRASTDLLQSHRPRAFPRSARGQALGRHEAETRAVLRADPRPRPPDPRRAHHRGRSFVAAPVLGADRPASARAGPA